METATTTQQLKDLKDEIDAITLLIASKEAKWESAADPDTKAILLASIADLKAEKAARSADRSLLLAALVAAPAPGKNPPSPSTPAPPPCMRTPLYSVFVQHAPPPPLVCVVLCFSNSESVCVLCS